MPSGALCFPGLQSHIMSRVVGRMARLRSGLWQVEQEAQQGWRQVRGAALPQAPLCEQRLHRRGLFPALKGPRFRGTEHPCLPKPVCGLDRRLIEPWGLVEAQASAFASAHSEVLFIYLYLEGEERGPKLLTKPTLPTHSAFLCQTPRPLPREEEVPDQPKGSSFELIAY